MARKTNAQPTVQTVEVADFELSTGQVSAVNRFASKVARDHGKAAVSLGSLKLPKTFFGAAKLVGHVSEDVNTDIATLRTLLEETDGLTRGALRTALSPTRQKRAEQRAAAKAKRAAKVTQAPKAQAKAKPAKKATPAKPQGNVEFDFDAINAALKG